MKKKTYVHPEMKVAKLEQTEIICTSALGTFSVGDATLVEGDDSDWGTDLEW